MSLKFDVVVAGAGTAGAYASYLLARAGLRVALLEARAGDQIGVKVCGDALGAHHVERMSRYLTPNPRAFKSKIAGVELVSPDESARLVIRGEGYMLDRAAWGSWLVGEAVRAGAELYEGYIAAAPTVSGSSVAGVEAVKKREGTRVELRARVVVDATGLGGALRTKLAGWPVSEPLSPEDVSHAYREILSVDGPVERPEYIKIFLNAEVAPGGYWWLFPYDSSTVNVGLGVWGISGVNPVERFRQRVLPRLRVRARIHAGGGVVPTRRPLKSLVGGGFVAVGDAAAAANPLHGGGIGQALLSAELSSRVIIRAFETGDFSERALWEYNVLYMREWGHRQAQLDVMRLMLQTLSNDDLNYGLSRRVLGEGDILDVSSRGVSPSLVEKLRAALQLLGRPSLLLKLLAAAQYASRIGELYMEYPESSAGLEPWHARVASAYEEYRRKIGLEPRGA
ncbi:MAG: NAD(P)/FAD-dependent oxidoreductase [Thermoproteaceae archaeon]|nr:NAD(P)/FAD-dependent oxidoreductase [Thermoproteaceae archaeon]